MQSKVCPQCRQLAPIDAPFCPSCGHAFRTQFAQPQPGYGQPMPPQPMQHMPGPYPPQVVYVPVPSVDPYARQNKGEWLKWVAGFLVLACLIAGAYLIAKRSGVPASQQSAQFVPPPVNNGVPTSAFNDEAANSSYHISIVWTRKGDSDVEAKITNKGPEVLPNLYIQFLTQAPSQSGGNADQWSDPYQVPISAEGVAIPVGGTGTFTFPIGFKQIERLHAYFVEQNPAGVLQHEVGIEQGP